MSVIRLIKRNGDKVVEDFGFLKNEDEPFAYRKINETAIIIMLYVDDILSIKNNIY